jgi:hypothetical protein
MLGIRSPSCVFREVTTNHHLYAALRIGHEIDKNFVVHGFDNLTVLPPTAYFDHACSANPTLKSLTLTQYAMDHIVRTAWADSRKSRRHSSATLFRVGS